MTWKPIAEAAHDGMPVLAVKESVMCPGHFPYPLTSRFINGKWNAEFGKDEWCPYEPQPTHFLDTAISASPAPPLATRDTPAFDSLVHNGGG